jgi:hypothetical protein
VLTKFKVISKLRGIVFLEMSTARQVPCRIDGSTHFIMFPIDGTVAHFLEIVKYDLGRSDFDAVCLEGTPLPLTDSIEEWFDTGVVFEVRSSSNGSIPRIPRARRTEQPPSALSAHGLSADQPSAAFPDGKHYVIHMNAKDCTVHLSCFPSRQACGLDPESKS